MNNFFEKTEYTESDILDLIKNQIEEAIDLEFKDAAALDKTDKKKNEISKDIASFANSAGGIILYGISEDKQKKATSISYIDGNKFTKEWLEQVIHSNIKQSIDNIEIIPVRFGKNISQTVYIVKIPQSNSSPHMSHDRKYYKRYNFQSVPMEEYEVRNLYYKTHITDLEIVEIAIARRSTTGTRQSGIHVATFQLQFRVINSGKSIENTYKIKLSVPNKIFSSLDPKMTKYSLEHVTENYTILSFPNDSPLFQGESAFSSIFSVTITKRTFDHPENFLLKSCLYYPNGLKEYSFDLREHLTMDDEVITDKMFVGD